MAEYTGKDLYLLWKGTSIDAHYRTFSPTEEGDTVDASAGADTHRTYLMTLLDGNASCTMVMQDGTAGTALWAAIAPSTTAGTLEWGPEGTASGAPRYHVQALLTTRNPSYTYDGVTEVSLEWSYTDSDGPTFTTY